MKIFVVGGGSGLGRALVEAALATGYQVGYSTSAPEDPFAGRASLVVTGCDLSSMSNGATLIEKITGFAPDRLVLCAIKTRYKRMDKQSAEDIVAEVQFNIAHQIALANAYAKVCPTGSVTFILSHICFLYNPGFALYKTGKEALDSFARAMQFDYPALKVLRVYPGAMRTGFVAHTQYSGASVFPAIDPALWANRILARQSGVLMDAKDWPFLLFTRFLPFTVQKFFFQTLFRFLQRPKT